MPVPRSSTYDAFSASSDDDIPDAAFARRRCCFCFPNFLKKEPTLGGSGGGGGGGSSGAFWRRIKPLDSSSPAAPWWSKSWKKVRGLSEGPRWKNLVRRFNGRKRQGYGKFNYDATSYALNFDEGPLANGVDYDEDLLGRGFSDRFSLPPSAKSSMDFDNDANPFNFS
ncbi:unnamed protein product [Linum tenue]|uniref:Uncharacterized protein n=1 Tax=Linum tenue TaxID=586396 RepID=A0AAV0NBQ4_9ROSI|nr:unnamed protein product [Linum tenue]